MRRDDLRSTSMVALGLVPILSVVALGAVWLNGASDRLGQLDREAQIIGVVATQEANRGMLARTLHVFQAAALPNASPAALERAERATGSLALRDSRAAEGEALMQPVGGAQAGSANDQAQELRAAIGRALAAHRPGWAVAPELLATEKGLERVLVEGANPGLLLQTELLDESANRLRSLSTLSVEFDRDLRLALSELGAGRRTDPSQFATNRPLQTLTWNEELQTWMPARVDVTTLSPQTAGLPDQPEREPFTTAFDALDQAVLASDEARRDRAVDRLLVIDAQLADALDGAERDGLAAAQEKRSEWARQRQLLTGALALLLLMGIALFVMSRQEMRRRRRVERAHIGALHEMKTKAYRDALTGLYNRRWLDEVLPTRLASLGPNDALTLVYIDLDGFKAINDVWGHDYGDAVLRHVGTRLHKARLRHAGGWDFARFGGDEFVGFRVVEAHTDAADVNDLVAELSSLKIEHERTAVALPMSVSAGAAIAQPGVTASDLVLQADSALALAKRRHRGAVCMYDPDGTATVELLRILPAALADGEITIAVQPLHDIASGIPTGVEVLSRWHRSTGSVSPEVFVSLIEAYGLSDELTRNVVHQVARARRADPGLPRTWINISPIELARTDFASRLLAVLEAEGVPPETVGIEVTESAAIRDVNEVSESLQLLRDHKIGVAIDDFGSGYTPLGYLRILPVDVIKIDRALIARVDEDPLNQEMVAGIVRIAGRLGIDVVAEGVERLEELDWLSGNGVQLVQGFLLSRPSAPHNLPPIPLSGAGGLVRGAR